MNISATPVSGAVPLHVWFNISFGIAVPGAKAGQGVMETHRAPFVAPGQPTVPTPEQERMRNKAMEPKGPWPSPLPLGPDAKLVAPTVPPTTVQPGSPLAVELKTQANTTDQAGPKTSYAIGFGDGQSVPLLPNFECAPRSENLPNPNAISVPH